MIDVPIPGYRHLQLGYLMLDYNGTLARDGKLLPGVKRRLQALSKQISIHVVTGGTFGNPKPHLTGVPCELKQLGEENQDAAKLEYLNELGADSTVCIGNGRNDRRMVETAALGIVVVQEEGAAVETANAADVVCTSILSALDLLTHPDRLKATLRS